MQKKWKVVLGIVATFLVLIGLYKLVLSGIMGTIIATLIFWPLATVGIYLVRKVGLNLVIVWFAKHDKWWSPVRMRPAAGHIVMMTKGLDPGGPFSMVLAGHIPYWHYHEGDRRFYKEDDSPIKSDWLSQRDSVSGELVVLDKGRSTFRRKFPNGPPRQEGILAKAGVVKVGFSHRYYRRQRRWDAWDIKPNTSQYGVVLKETNKEDDHIFYFATTIVVDLETVPTSDNYPAQMKVIENILLIHPEKAEFVAGKWETQATAATRTRAREYIARHSVAKLKEERDTDKKDEFVDYILFANEGDPNETRAATVRLLPEYGIAVQGPFYADFDLESGDKEMTAAMKRQMIASEDVKTAAIRMEETVVKAKAEKEKRRIEAEGAKEARMAEAEGIKAEFAARMSVPEGADLSWAEAVKTAAPKYISLGRDGKGGIIVGVPEEK